MALTQESFGGVFELRYELHDFLKARKTHLALFFSVQQRMAKLTYLANILVISMDLICLFNKIGGK